MSLGTTDQRAVAGDNRLEDTQEMGRYVNYNA